MRVEMKQGEQVFFGPFCRITSHTDDGKRGVAYQFAILIPFTLWSFQIQLVRVYRK